MPDTSDAEQKQYHKRATGLALATVKKRSKDSELKLYGSCFWYVLEFSTLHLLSVVGERCG